MVSSSYYEMNRAFNLFSQGSVVEGPTLSCSIPSTPTPYLLLPTPSP